MAPLCDIQVMQMTIRRNPYRTRYITWLDIGLFRHITTARSAVGEAPSAPSGQPRFRLELPPGFVENRSIAFSEAYARIKTLTPKEIVYRNSIWLSGAYFVGRVDWMYRWTEDYLSAYEWLLRNNLTNTDEQAR